MIYLVTGTPGAGKSLNTIKFVNEESSFQDRPKFYFNVKGLDPSFGWKELSEDEAKTWYDLPEGSIIFFDEAYDIFPQRGPSHPTPEHVKRLATHRHKGFDIVMVCQKVKGQLDSFIRGLVNYHYHYVRQFGTPVVTRYVWNRCIEDVNNYHDLKQAQKKLIKYDKKYFKAYKSAEVHTVKVRLPWLRLSAFPVLLSIIGFSAWTAVDTLGGDRSPDPGLAASSSGLSDSSGFLPTNNNVRPAVQTKMDWFEARQARVPGFAHTAPIYDEVTQPVTFPRPNCIVWDVEEREGDSECRCYSQQATRMDVPTDICLSIVQNGWFDATIPSNESESEYARNRGSAPVASSDRSASLQSTPRYYGPPPSYLIGEGNHLITASSK